MNEYLTVPVIVLSVAALVLWLFVLIVALWQVYMAVAGARPRTEGSLLEQKRYVFGVVICARNEESVIAALIESLKAQEYPSDLFDIIVVADNCTDATAAVAREHGATVLERFDSEHIGKGYALEWVFDQLLHGDFRRYEAFTVFDADNVVDPMYLQYVNAALCSGADATQCYRETKNPFDSVISGCYAIYWYMLTRFYHQVRSNRGLPCSIGGTGFAFKRHTIEENGWHTETLTEDSEFASRLILKGGHIQFVREAITYDEQPTSWRVSVTQRLRWMCGLTQESKLLLADSYRAWRGGNRHAFDVMMFLLSVPAIAATLVAGVVSTLAAVLTAMKLWEEWYIVLLGSLLLLAGGIYVFSFAAGWFSLKLEKGRVGRFWPALWIYPLFLAPMTLFVLISYFKTDREWEPIVHLGSGKILHFHHHD